MLLGDAAVISSDLTALDWSLIALFAGGVFLVVNRSREPISYCDTSPDRLDRVRVNAGLIVGFLIAAQALLANGRAAWLETPIWACMIAVLLSFLVRHWKSRPNAMVVR